MATEVAERVSGYVWHSMPDQVRHTSVAERRAALAAAQKAAENANKANGHREPSETRQNGHHAQKPQEVVAAPAEEPHQQEEEQQHVEEQQHQEEEPVKPQPEEQEEQQPEEEQQEEPQQEEQQQQQREEPQAAAAAAPEEKPAADAPSTAAVQEPTTTGTKRRSKTKHAVHFRGARWEKALKTDRKRIEAAFRQDVHNATGLDENRMESIEFTFDKVLNATFIVRHDSEDKVVSEAHGKLNSYKFPLTTALYPKS